MFANTRPYSRICVSMCTCVRVSAYSCVYVNASAYVFMRTCILIHTHLYVYTHLCVYSCFRVFVRTCTLVSMYIHVFNYNRLFAQSDGAVKYNDCTSTKGKDTLPNECPGYDTKQSDGKVPVMLELWGMRSTLSLPLLPGLLWPGMVATDRAIYRG